MRNLLLASAAIAVLGMAGAASAQDINVAPQQSNHGYPYPPSTVTITTIKAGATTASASEVGNVITASVDPSVTGSIAINQSSPYGPNQASDGTQTGTLSVTKSTLAGASLSADATSNEIGATTFNAGATINGATQLAQGAQDSSASVRSVTLSDTSSVSSESAGNVLTATGYGVTLTPATNGWAMQTNVANQSSSVKLADVTVTGGGSFTAMAQSVANDAELTGFQAGVSLSGSQDNGYGTGTYNAVTGYPGSSTSATLAAHGLTIYSGVAALTAQAVGNNLVADASYGGSITGSFSQTNLNTSGLASVNLSSSSFGAGLTASSLVIGNSASFKTH